MSYDPGDVYDEEAEDRQIAREDEEGDRKMREAKAALPTSADLREHRDYQKRLAFAVGHAGPGEPIQTLVFRCAWCNPHQPGEAVSPRLSHGMCPACERKAMAEIGPDPVAHVIDAAFGDRFRDLATRLPHDTK